MLHRLLSTVCWFHPVFIGVAWHTVFQRKLVACGPAGWACPAEWSSHGTRATSQLCSVSDGTEPCVRGNGKDGKGVFTGRLTCRCFSLGLGPPEAAWIVLYIHVDDIKYWIGKAKLLHDLCSLEYDGWTFICNHVLLILWLHTCS